MKLCAHDTEEPQSQDKQRREVFGDISALFICFILNNKQIRTHCQSAQGSDLFVVVEISGIEPLTS